MSLGEAVYIAVGFTRVFLIWALERVGFISNGDPQPTINDILDPKVLGRLIQQPVQKVSVDQVNGVSQGAGGTGTGRAALLVELNDGSILHLFAKVPTTAWAERAFFTLFGVYDNEVNFYADRFMAMNAKLRRDNWDIGPRVHYCKRLGLGKFLMILEDPRFRAPKGAIFKTTMEVPFSVPRSAKVLSLLARMHAFYWGEPPSSVWHYCPKTGKNLGSTPPFLRVLAYEGFKQVQKRYGKETVLHQDVVDGFLLALKEYFQLRAFWSDTRCLTLSHGDAHMGNVFVSSDEQLAGLIDLQCVAQDHCCRDISYHLVNSCPANELQLHERQLLEGYLSVLRDELKACGKERYLVDVPDYDEFYFHYRLHAVWSLIAWIICCGFSDVVTHDFAGRSLQRALDTCQRLQVHDAVKEALRRQRLKSSSSSSEKSKWM